ncbi:MAG: ATPase domain-containing protein [Candidatus Bilamarchaeaceae archaeon]
MSEQLNVDEDLPVLRKNRWSTGIRELDIMLEGGYRNPGNILLVGPSGLEKFAFAYHFANGATEEENVYFICGGISPEELIKKAATLAINLKKPNIKFIDCYTSTLGGVHPTESENIKIVPGPRALNDLSLAINDALKESSGKRIRFIFHTLSVFILYNPQESIRKFMDVINGRLKAAGATTLYLVDEGVHDKQMMGMIEHGIDEKYIIKEKDGTFSLELPIINYSVSFRLGPAGVVFL